MSQWKECASALIRLIYFFLLAFNINIDQAPVANFLLRSNYLPLRNNPAMTYGY